MTHAPLSADCPSTHCLVIVCPLGMGYHMWQEGILPPSFNSAILAQTVRGILSDFVCRVFKESPSCNVLLLNLLPADCKALMTHLSSVTCPGTGKKVEYYVKPLPNCTVQLSGGKPSAAEVREGWQPDAVTMRFNTMRAEATPIESLCSGGRFDWAFNSLGITTGNYWYGPELLFASVTPRPLIGKAESRVEWTSLGFEVNRDTQELESEGHYYLPKKVPITQCDDMMTEALQLDRRDWVGIFNDEWPSAETPRSGVRRMATTWFGSPQPDLLDLPVLRKWAADFAQPLIAAVLPGCRCNSLGYVLAEEGATAQLPHRDVIAYLLPPTARHYSVFAALSSDTPGAAGGYFVPNSSKELPARGALLPRNGWRGGRGALGSALGRAGGMWGQNTISLVDG